MHGVSSVSGSSDWERARGFLGVSGSQSGCASWDAGTGCRRCLDRRTDLSAVRYDIKKNSTWMSRVQHQYAV